MEDTYYFITVFKEYDEYGPRMMRCWGFYKDLSDAVVTVRHNVTDLWETIYEYAIIEEYHEGIGGYNFNRWFFRYNQEIRLTTMKKNKVNFYSLNCNFIK